MKKYLIVRPGNRLMILGLVLAFFIFAGIAAYSSYYYERESYLMHCGNAVNLLHEAYSDKAYSLSDVYSPIFRQEQYKTAVRSYFGATDQTAMDAYLRAALLEVTSLMMETDPDIDFIILWNPDLTTSYWLQRGERSLTLLPEDFPWAPNSSGYSLHGAIAWKDSHDTLRRSFVIQGGSVYLGGKGSILVGYSVDALDTALRRSSASTKAAYLVLANDQVVFDSSALRYGQYMNTDWIMPERMYQWDQDGNLWYVGMRADSGRSFTTLYLFPHGDLFLLSMTNAWRVLLVMLIFMLFFLAVYILSTHHILNRVNAIRENLQALGSNRLDVRLEVSPHHDEFDEIAQNINIMAGMLEENIEKEYELRLRQVQLELKQIQARFNPHFLYNTLELIRGQMCQRGDTESAAYLEKLSRIFRNLTSSKSFVSIREEISFCTVYVSLLELRYENAVSVAYDIAPEVLDCGVLSNLIQPVIENYFVHALDENADSNELEIACHAEDDEHLLFIISNNGFALAPERLTELNDQLRSPDVSARSYGLASIARRTLLFYGPDCGIQLAHNPNGQGVQVSIRIRRMSMEEHRNKLMYYK